LKYRKQGGTEAIESLLKVKIPRNVPVTTYPFMDYFKGFEKVEAVKRIFGEKT
jgi:hypothetical protein